MGLYNTLLIECENCKNNTKEIQFKYGEVSWETFYHRYKIGEKIKWDKNKKENYGSPGKKKIIIEGEGYNCKCGYNGEAEYNILIQDDIIKNVKRITKID
jgi:hypothetical protein